jgi:CheY-like chemotaxis protein
MRGRGAAVVTANVELTHGLATRRISLLADPRLTGSVDAGLRAVVRCSADMPLSCIIVDDNERFCESTRRLLEDEGIVVVGTASTGEEAARIAADVDPDVALVDIDLGGESGFDVARALTTARGRARPRVILISTHDEREVADLVAASPAVGFLAKLDLSAEAIHDLLARADDRPLPS